MTRQAREMGAWFKAINLAASCLGVRFMLQTLDSEIREYFRHTAERSRRADESRFIY